MLRLDCLGRTCRSLDCTHLGLGGVLSECMPPALPFLCLPDNPILAPPISLELAPIRHESHPVFQFQVVNCTANVGMGALQSMMGFIDESAVLLAQGSRRAPRDGVFLLRTPMVVAETKTAVAIWSFEVCTPCSHTGPRVELTTKRVFSLLPLDHCEEEGHQQQRHQTMIISSKFFS